MFRKALSLIIVTSMLATVLIFVTGCNRRLDFTGWTEEDHITQISELVENSWFRNGSWYLRSGWGSPLPDQAPTSFDVTIINGFDGEREWFLVEFYPVGHAFGKIKEGYYLLGGVNGLISQFKLSDVPQEDRYMAWSLFARKDGDVIVPLNAVNTGEESWDMDLNKWLYYENGNILIANWARENANVLGVRHTTSLFGTKRFR